MRNKIDTYIAESMKKGSKDQLETLKLVKAEFQKASHSGKPWNEAKVMKSMIKSREEAAKIYREAERDDLAEKEESEIQVIQGLLPPQASPEEIKAEILRVISNIDHAVTLKDTKEIISKVSEVYPEVTGKEVSEIIKSL